MNSGSAFCSIPNFAQVCADFLDGALSDEETLQMRCELIRSRQARQQFIGVIEQIDALKKAKLARI